MAKWKMQLRNRDPQKEGFTAADSRFFWRASKERSLPATNKQLLSELDCVLNLLHMIQEIIHGDHARESDMVEQLQSFLVYCDRIKLAIRPFLEKCRPVHVVVPEVSGRAHPSFLDACHSLLEERVEHILQLVPHREPSAPVEDRTQQARDLVKMMPTIRENWPFDEVDVDDLFERVTWELDASERKSVGSRQEQPTEDEQDSLGDFRELVKRGILGDHDVKIVRIASNHSKSVDERMREIAAIDLRVFGFTSPQWAALFKCSDGWIRQQEFWRVDRIEYSGPDHLKLVTRQLREQKK